MQAPNGRAEAALFAVGRALAGRQQARFPPGELGRGGLTGEQGRIDGPRPLQCFGVDENIGEGIEAGHRGPMAHGWRAQCPALGLDC